MALAGRDPYHGGAGIPAAWQAAIRDGGFTDRLGRRDRREELGDGFLDRDGAQSCQGPVLRDANRPCGHAEGAARLLGR
jgi:hypothetical protein